MATKKVEYKQKSGFPQIIEEGIEKDFKKSYSILIQNMTKEIASKIIK